MWPFLFTPLGKLAGTALIVLGAWFAFARHYENKGAEKVIAKMERATNEAVTKARRAGTKSAAGGGVRNPHYRD